MLFEDGDDLMRKIRLSKARVGRGDGQEHGEQAIQAVHGEILWKTRRRLGLVDPARGSP